MEDEGNEGLTVADNVIHEPEGYKSIGLQSAGAFSTTGGLAASVYTVGACAARSVGDGSDAFCAWIANDTLHVGLNGVTATTAVTGYPLTFGVGATLRSDYITALDVCESYGKIFFIARGYSTTLLATTSAHKTMTGYMDY